MTVKQSFPPLPKRPFFGSGPCAKPVGWSLEHCRDALVGRSHRSDEGLSAIRQVISSLRDLVGIPRDYEVLLTPGSATGSCEMAIWNLLGSRPVDALCWDVFSRLWRHNVREQLGLDGQDIIVSAENFDPVRTVQELSKRNPFHDLVLTWTGTTSGTEMNQDCFDGRLKNADGLVLCDATAAVMTANIPWGKMDAISFSWQKALGGEASLGVLVLSPKAMDRLESWSPPWPMPRLLRLKKGESILRGVMNGETINTPSMLLIKEMQVILDLWHRKGGLGHALYRVTENNKAMEKWCADSPWASPLIRDPLWRARGPMILSVDTSVFRGLSTSAQWFFVQKMGQYLYDHRAAFDIINHPHECPALRIWCGPSIETEDLTALFPWIDRAFSFACRAVH